MIRTNTTVARQKFQRLRAEVGTEMQIALQRGARLACVQLSFATQPRGHGEESRVKGEKAVQKEVRRVYAIAADVYASIENKKIGAAFYAAVQNRQIAKAQRILDANSSTFAGTPIGTFDPSLHKTARVNGKVPKKQRPLQVVQANRPLTTYIEREKRMVGFVKSGWAVCARLVGGTRGIPQWVTRHVAGSAGRVVDLSRDPITPRIMLTNGVSYAREQLDEVDARQALEDAKRNLFDSIVRGLRAAARRSGMA